MPIRLPLAAAAALVLLPAVACRDDALPTIAEGRLDRGAGGSARSVRALVPDRCRAGERFRPQPDGDAELVVVGTGLTRTDTVRWNGRPLKTGFGSSRALSADVPPDLLQSPGEIEVTVEDALDPALPRLRARFVVRPPT